LNCSATLRTRFGSDELMPSFHCPATPPIQLSLSQWVRLLEGTDAQGIQVPPALLQDAWDSTLTQFAWVPWVSERSRCILAVCRHLYRTVSSDTAASVCATVRAYARRNWADSNLTSWQGWV
jgi:hypothetical protein